MNELRHAFRSLLTTPAVAAVAILTLAIAIGANTAIFTVVRALVFAPLPYPGAERIVVLSQSHHAKGLDRFGVSSADFRDWTANAHAFDALAAYTTSSANLAGTGTPERVRVASVTARFFDVFGVQPVAGRAAPSDWDRPDRAHVVVLSAALWQRRYGARMNIVGDSITLGGEPFTIAGVMPASFAFPDRVDLWKPLSLADDRTSRGARWLEAVGRVRGDVSLAQAAAELGVVQQQLDRAYPGSDAGWTADVLPLRDAIAGDSRTALMLLWGAVALVLVIACVNVAGLLLARGVDRQREFAVRAALGASAMHVVRQLLAEGALLGLIAGLIGTALGAGMLRGLVWLAPASTLRLEAIPLDRTVLALAMVVAMATSLIFGLAPAWHLATDRVQFALQAGGRSASARAVRPRQAFVVIEIALAIVLLAGSGLMLRTVERLVAVPTGFDAQGVLTFRVAPPQTSPAIGESAEAFQNRYVAERDRMVGFYDRAMAKVGAIPGVQSAAAINRLPLTGNWWSDSLSIQGRAVDETASIVPKARVITAGYFATLRVPILSGRDVSGSDRDTASRVAVINESLARVIAPNESAIGKKICLCKAEGSSVHWLTIVGVVGDVRQTGLTRAAEPTVYVPLAQAIGGFYPDWGMDVVVRAAQDPMVVAPAVRSAFHALDGTLPLFQLRTLDQVIAAGIEQQRFVAVLFVGFAGGALALAGVGIFGLVSYLVAVRSREIAIRLAVGAPRSRILAMVIRSAVALGGAGVLIGLPAALAATRLMGALLFGVTPSDPLTFAAVSAIAAIAVLVASYIPAHRATRLDPILALRSE